MVQPFRTSAGFQLILLLDGRSLLRAPCCRIPRTANIQIQELQIPSIVTFQTSHTACLHCTCWRQQQKFVGAVKLADQKQQASTSCSHWLHPLNDFGPNKFLQMAPFLQCSPCPGWNDKAFSRYPSLGNCLRPMHSVEPSSPSAHDRVQFSVLYLIETSSRSARTSP